jgi:hypothetical protein
MKKVILVDGGKGGVGKSMVATTLVDRLLADGIKPRIVEADGSVPDVGRRFKDRGVVIAYAPLGGDELGEDRVIQVFSRVFHGEDLVVMNLPAGAGEVLDTHAELIGETAKMAGVDLVHAWVVGADSASADLAGISIKSGLASVATHRVVVINEVHGNPESFQWADSTARNLWLSSGATEHAMPRLPASVHNAVEERRGGFREALPHMNLMQQVALKRWLSRCDPMLDAMLE